MPPLEGEDAWRDPSPHAVTFVAVEQGVELEVLDWGGHGPPVLLLAGLGDTAHIFDDFAPALTARHRVCALTRRGFGRSSAPESGYGIERLAADVISAIGALGLKDPVIVGHSFAGEEMHILGRRHASDVAGLVYIDAAFDRTDRSRDCEAKLRELPSHPRPQASDMRSIATLRDFNMRHGLPLGPEAAVRDRYVVDAAGVIGSARTPVEPVRQGLTATMAALMEGDNPEPIRVPAVALYAVPERPGDLMHPWYDRSDRALEATVQELFVLTGARHRRHTEWFEAFVHGSARVVALPGRHHLFISHPAEVAAEIETLASSLG